MTKDALRVIAEQMSLMQLRYGLMEYNSKPLQYPYFIGSYMESAPLSESGGSDTSFTLTGYSRTTWQELETAKDKIRAKFDPISGYREICEGGNAVVILYENAHPVDTWDEELREIIINLKIKEWRVT